MAPAKRPATYADIEALPEHLIGELIDGELVVSPRPQPPHAQAGGAIYAELYGPFQRGHGGPGGWWLCIEPEIHIGGHVLVPDIAGWRRERLPEIPARAAITVAPNWICEVLSPSTARIDRTRKMGIYGAQGVEHLWLADPLLRMVELYRWRDDGWMVAGMYANDARCRIAPFEDIELDLSHWWLPLPPGAAAESPVVWTIGAR